MRKSQNEGRSSRLLHRRLLLVEVLPHPLVLLRNSNARLAGEFDGSPLHGMGWKDIDTVD
jgi:hypothetical protein